MTTTVLGRPVQGDITPPTRENTAEQWPGERFLPLLDAVLNCANVKAVTWTQYTPYFNDGEPCVFGVNDPSVVLTNPDAADDEEENDDPDRGVDLWSMRDYKADVRGNAIKPEFAEIQPIFKELTDNMDHFEDFLQESFGDHATVTATREGFSVEFYEHD